MRMAILAACRLALGIVVLVLCLAGPSGAKIISITGSSYGDDDGDAYISLSGKKFSVYNETNSGGSGNCGGDFAVYKNNPDFTPTVIFASSFFTTHGDWQVGNVTSQYPNETIVSLQFVTDPDYLFPSQAGYYELAIPATVTGSAFLTALQGDPVTFFVDITGTSIVNVAYYVWEEENGFSYETNTYSATFSGVADVSPEHLPEPSTLLLLGAGFVAIVPFRKKIIK